MFIRNTLTDQPKPAVFYGISKILKIPEVIKTVMAYRIIVDENILYQAAIYIVMQHILPSFGPIISGKGCLTENMPVYVVAFLCYILIELNDYSINSTKENFAYYRKGHHIIQA